VCWPGLLRTHAGCLTWGCAGPVSPADSRLAVRRSALRRLARVRAVPVARLLAAPSKRASAQAAQARTSRPGRPAIRVLPALSLRARACCRHQACRQVGQQGRGGAAACASPAGRSAGRQAPARLCGRAQRWPPLRVLGHVRCGPRRVPRRPRRQARPARQQAVRSASPVSTRGRPQDALSSAHETKQQLYAPQELPFSQQRDSTPQE
jgi:hypothetical protein